jgi:polyisoprenyl-phosphate glycosyltransferase
LLSIIIPVHNEAENIPLLCQQLSVCCSHPFEVIFVNDGSTDSTLNSIKKIIEEQQQIKCISLSRNFGHQNALMAGLAHATGEQIVIMDGDLQHPPALIPAMLDLLMQGFDIVHARRQKTSNISWLKQVTGAIFYKFINFISDTPIAPNVADFKAFNKKVLMGLLQFKERDLFLRGIFSWMGYKATIINFDAPARQYGSTKYSFGKMLKLALRGTTSFSFKPLRLALLIGSIISMVAFAFGVFALVAYFNEKTVPGWTSIIIAVMFLGGTQLLAIGLLGEYIASLFTEAKQRPLYLVDEKINMD